MIRQDLCFNPYRVFKFVATQPWTGVEMVELALFQSLSGFQVRCNFISAGVKRSLKRFQSLSGFQVRCNLISIQDSETKVRKFQSLSGFQVRCNSLNNVAIERSTMVFQSLSGFQVRCNIRNSSDAAKGTDVSIPIGFSSSLQHKYL